MRRYVVACAIASLAGCDRGADPSSPGLVVLDQVEYPCELRFEPTGVVVESDSAGAYPDPSPRLSRAPDGRLYAPSRLGGHIVVFGPDGVFQRTIGRPGEGPGELGNGMATSVVGDALHVVDPSLGRWNRYTLDGRFLSSGSSIFFRNVGSGSYEVVGTDSILTAGSAGNDGYQFHLLDGRGEQIGRFGALAEEPRPNGGTIAPGSGRTFWAAPEQGSGEYVLQEWSYDGRLLRRLERRVPWFDRVRESEPTVEEGGRPLFPVIMHPFAGANGQIVVAAFVTDGPVGDLLEAWYEVIDPESETVLASREVPMDGKIPPMFRVSPGGPLGAGATPDENDLYRIELLRYELSPRANSADAVRACRVDGPESAP